MVRLWCCKSCNLVIWVLQPHITCLGKAWMKDLYQPTNTQLFVECRPAVCGEKPLSYLEKLSARMLRVSRGVIKVKSGYFEELRCSCLYLMNHKYTSGFFNKPFGGGEGIVFRYHAQEIKLVSHLHIALSNVLKEGISSETLRRTLNFPWELMMWLTYTSSIKTGMQLYWGRPKAIQR